MARANEPEDRPATTTPASATAQAAPVAPTSAVEPPRPTVYHTTGLPAEVEPDQSPESEPKPVSLGRPPKGESHAALRPPVANAGGPIPRTIHQNERAPDGFGRFRIRCLNYAPQPIRYVLAQSEDKARQHYLKVTGLASMVKKARKYDPLIPDPQLKVVALAD